MGAVQTYMSLSCPIHSPCVSICTVQQQRAVLYSGLGNLSVLAWESAGTVPTCDLAVLEKHGAEQPCSEAPASRFSLSSFIPLPCPSFIPPRAERLMFSFSRVAAVFTAALTLSSSVYGIGKVTRTGRYLYNSDGSRFYIKGVAYQEQGKYYSCQDFCT